MQLISFYHLLTIRKALKPKDPWNAPERLWRVCSKMVRAMRWSYTTERHKIRKERVVLSRSLC